MAESSQDLMKNRKKSSMTILRATSMNWALIEPIIEAKDPTSGASKAVLRLLIILDMPISTQDGS